MIDPVATTQVANAIVDGWLANIIQGIILMVVSGTGLGIIFVFKSLNIINIHLAKLNGRTRTMEEWQKSHESADMTALALIHTDIERIDAHIIEDLVIRARAAENH